MTIQPAHVTMRLLILFIALIFPLLATAQDDRRGQGYVFGMVGGADRGLGAHVGGGAGFEKLFYKGLGAGADLAGFWGSERGSSYGGLLLSANGSYHFNIPAEPGRMSPFGTGGFSAVGLCEERYFCGGTTGFNLGGGFHYWTSRNRGLRVEFRDHIFQIDESLHVFEVRIGLAF